MKNSNDTSWDLICSTVLTTVPQIKAGVSKLFREKSHMCYYALVRQSRAKNITLIGTPNLLNYREVFTKYIQFTIVTAGHITQPGESPVGTLMLKVDQESSQN